MTTRMHKSLQLLLLLAFFPTLALTADHPTIACVGGKVYPSPTTPAIENAILLIEDGKITAVADRLVQAGVNELKQYFSGGGAILFGTDVGFQSTYDTTQKFEFMGRAMSNLRGGGRR